MALPLPAEPLRRVSLSWLILFALYAVVAFFVVDRAVARTYAWVYPRWNDQIQYLTEAYAGYDTLRSAGTVAAVQKTLGNEAAQGAIHDTLALGVFAVAGPSRSAALAVFVLLWLALQAAWVLWVRRWTGQGATAVAAVGLLWLWWTPWSGRPGSFADFRLDGLAACAWGLALVAALATRGFTRRGESLLFGAVVGLGVALRFLTAVYWAGVFFVFILWILSRPDRGRRLARLAGAGAAAVLTALPLVWPNRLKIWEYYVVGHFSGRESSVRDLHFSLGQSLRETLRWFYEWHSGPVLLLAVVVGLVLGMAAWRRSKRDREELAAWWVPTVAMGMVPWLVLALHRQKSPVVESVMAPSLIALGVWGWGLAFRWLVPARVGLGLAGLLAGAGLAQAYHSFARVSDDVHFVQEARLVNRVTDRVWEEARLRHWNQPRVAVNRITDCFDGQILRVMWQERKRQNVPVLMTLPTGIGEESDELMWDRLRESDFVFLAGEAEQPGNYPYDAQMNRLGPAMRVWCEANLERLEAFRHDGRDWVLYVRRAGP